MPLCPNCQQEYPEGAQSCPHCGYAFTAPPPHAGTPGEPATTPSPDACPWENKSLPLMQRFIDTVKAVATQPVDFFKNLRPETGDWIQPFLYALICGYIGAIARAIYSTLFSFGMNAFLPSSLRGMGFFSGTSLIAALFITPFAVALGLLIGTLVLHLLLSLFGGASQKVEATYRTLAYAYTYSLAGVIPFLGGLIQFFWAIFLLIVGLREVHRTTTGKAAMAVLIPLIVCLLCAFVLIGVAGLAIFKGLQNM